MNWGSVGLGAIVGLGAGILVGLPLFAVGIADADTFSGQAVLIVVGLTGQLAAGYVAARLTDDARAAHGGLAGLALYAVVALISLAAGADPPLATLVFGAVVASILGTAGGVLAEAAPAE